jgi:short-chain Z-isoprenyl diphosphate synthase
MSQETILPVAVEQAIGKVDEAAFAAPAINRLAVILDGNRRWASRRQLPTIEGYRAGGKNVHALLSWCRDARIPMVTLWPLSTDNLKRDADELQGLLTVIVEVLDAMTDGGLCRLRVIGDLTRLPPAVMERIRTAERRTAGVDGIDVNVAIAYSGRLELLHAFRSLISEYAAAGTLDQLPGDLDAELVASRLYTAGLPDPDFVIRTSGEQRLSNFMQWQSSYSELYFTPVCWPDFRRSDFDEAMRFFHSRQRRFGR